ncbi:MAG: nucleotidyltransferase family protein, partial [Dolichospermum sp.]
MNRENLINLLKENLTTIKSYGVTSLALFGSFARDEAKSTSDLDLLVEFQGKVTFDQYMDLKFFLEDN